MRSGLGIINPMFFIGVIEDNDDKTGQGRVKVRAFGAHGSLADIETKDLPWCLCVSGAYTPNNPIPPLNSFVFGVFLDGDEAQHPMVLGMIPTQYSEAHNPEIDGWGVIPGRDPDLLAKGSRPSDLHEPATSRLVRGEKIETTFHRDVSVNAVQDQKIANSDKTWSQPDSAYAAKYPYNTVIETARHTIELDDTPYQERIMIHHKSGSFIQIDAIGTVTERAESDRYEINIGTKHESSGSSVVTINGNAHVYVKGNKTEEIMGDYKLLVHGNHEVNVGQNLFQLAGTSLQARAANVKIEANSDTLTLFGRKEIQFEAENQLNFVSANIKNTALMNYEVYSNKSIKFTTLWDVHMQASNIIMTAHGLIPPLPINGATVGTPGFSLTTPAVSILAAIGSFSGLWNASVINGGIVTGTSVNATTLQATTMSSLAATFGVANAAVLRAAAYNGPIGSTAASVTPPSIALPSIPVITPPAQSILKPPPLGGSIFSGYAYPSPNGDIVSFFTGVLSSPFAVLGIPNPLGTGGYGIKRVQAPEPVAPATSIFTSAYNFFGSAAGWASPLGDTAKINKTFDLIGSLTGDNVILDVSQVTSTIEGLGFDTNGAIIVTDTNAPTLSTTVFAASSNTETGEPITDEDGGITVIIVPEDGG